MKHLISALAVAVIMTAPACTREIDPPAQQEHVKEPYRILAIGKTPGDTSTSSTMWARTETVGLVTAEDSKLRAELIGYQNINGHGVYTVAMTSKLNCQSNLQWGWEQLNIDSIGPNAADRDVLPANGYKVFTLVGDAKVGKIKVQAQSDCGNSSTLIVNITLAILPITYIQNTAKYDASTDRVTLDFTIDRPETINWFLVQKLQADRTWITVFTVPADDNIKTYRVPIPNSLK